MKKTLKWIIPILIGCTIAILVMSTKGIFTANDSKTIIHILTYSFIVPGVVITGVGLLVFVSNEGVFDIIIYGVYQFVTMFSANPAARKYKSFNDYREIKRSSKMSFGNIVIVGLGFLLISGIFAIIWLNM